MAKATVSALKAFAAQSGYTHAWPDGWSTERSTGMIKLYAVDECDICGAHVQAANSIAVDATLTAAGEAGLVLDMPPEEGGWSEDKGCATCSDCA